MATVNLGRIKPVFKGAYAGGTAFVVDDIVTSGNETFICILASTGNATSNATYWTKLASKGADGTNGSNGTNGTDVGTVITTQGDLLYRDGSGLQRLAKGTASQELRMNSGATSPEWHTPAVASSDYVKISTTNVPSASAITQINFQSVFDQSTYRAWRILIQNTKGVSGAGKLSMRYLNGTTAKTSNYDWNFHDLKTLYHSTHENHAYYGLSDSEIPFSQIQMRDSGAYEFNYIDITILNNGSASISGNGSMHWKYIGYSGGSGAFQNITGGGYNSGFSNTVHDGFQLRTTGGTAFACDVSIYGIK